MNAIQNRRDISQVGELIGVLLSSKKMTTAMQFSNHQTFLNIVKTVNLLPRPAADPLVAGVPIDQTAQKQLEKLRLPRAQTIVERPTTLCAVSVVLSRQPNNSNRIDVVIITVNVANLVQTGAVAGQTKIVPVERCV
jgi:hypothetical protein